MLYIILKSVHLLLMSLWLASTIKGLSDAYKLPYSVIPNIAIREKHNRITEVFGIVSGMGTIISGIALALVIGFSSLPWPVHLGLVISIVMALIAALGVGRVFHKIAAQLNDNVDISTLSAEISLLQCWYSVILSLWMIVFLLMALRFVF